jgi:hypothetical protein
MRTPDESFQFRLTPGAKTLLAVGLTAAFAVAAAIGVTGALTTASGAGLRPVLLAIFIPVTALVVAYAALPRFRAWVLSLDPRMLTLFQSWRVIGFGFLPLYAYGVLPGLFAWPAGLGDVAIGLAAPFVAARLARDPGYAASRGYLWFHLAGLLDFVGAAGTAMLASGAFPALHAGLPTSAPMEVWPLFLFPGFLVPIFIALHLAALVQIVQVRRKSATLQAA